MEDFLQLNFSQLHQFHFIRPQWLWSILLLVAVWLLRNQMNKQSHWRNVLPPHLAQVLLNSSETPKNNARRGKVLIWFWLIATMAMAGPTWQKIEKPVFQVKRASVILLDMSLSMRSTDIKPNRLSRARFKAIDLAEAIGDGEVALVAYAGDAFTISPLTPDARNLTALIPSLTPEIMPEPGSYPLLGLERSAELLVQAGYLTGDIFWFTDGIDDFDLQQIRTFAANTTYRINIIALGTNSGAPIKLADGSLLKDSTGSIVIPKLATAPLIKIADMTNGLFVTTTANDRDIKTLASLTGSPKEDQNRDSDNPDKKLTGDDWHEFGPYLVLLILPFFVSKFRRGSVFSALLVVGLITSPNQATAAPLNAVESDVSGGLGQSNIKEGAAKVPLPPPRPWYDTLFKTADKYGQDAYNKEDYLRATTDFDNQQWKGSAAYKAGDYETALNYFSQDKSANGWYNRGNALAQLQKIDEAIEAYDNTLKIQPSHQQAIENKALLEQMKQQQEQQDQQSDQSQDGEQQGSDQQQQSDEQEQSEGDNQSESDSESEQSQQENSQQSDPSAEPQDDSQSEQQQAEQTESDKEQQEAEAAAAQEKQQGEESEQEAAMTPLTAEQIAEQEQQQKIEQLLRKVSDDPATLLRNKMILENRKRQQSNRAPKGAKKSW